MTILLSRLISGLTFKKMIGSDQQIRDLQTDSRKIKAGDLFICLKGFTVDGHDFVPQAVKQGAVAILTERELADLPSSVTQIIVKDTYKAMAKLSSVFFEHPSKRLPVIGVTGTNGKTTTTWITKQIYEQAGYTMGLIGTIENRIGDRVLATKNTTPESLELQRLFKQMADSGCHYAVMEVSSHALALGRTWGTSFTQGVFTNLSPEHLDFHQTMEAYQEAKGLLFARLKGAAILNADEPATGYFKRLTEAEVITYGINNQADIQAKNIRMTNHEMNFLVETFKGNLTVTTKYMGTFNIYNILAAIGSALAEGIPLSNIENAVKQLKPVPGRMEPIPNDKGIQVFVDYAHTPDSLENVLKTAREFTPHRLICVVGCGGNRDKTKRPVMASIAEKWSDYVVLTSDNPRLEPPEQIIAEMETGMCGDKYVAIVDREEAIAYALEQAKPGDTVLIAGKGHETYQIIGTESIHFDDREIARKYLGPENI